MRRVAALLLCVLLACGAFAGCSQVEEIVSGVAATGEFPVEVNGVNIQSRPSRVVVLSPSLADVVLALGYETQLAGASEECSQSALQELEKVAAGDVEAIQGLQPDLVLLDSNSSDAQSALEGPALRCSLWSPLRTGRTLRRPAISRGGPPLWRAAASDMSAGIAAAQEYLHHPGSNINRHASPGIRLNHVPATYMIWMEAL